MAAGPAANPTEPVFPTLVCTCKSCQYLELTRKIVYAEIASRVLNQRTVDMWNEVVENHECESRSQNYENLH